MDFPNLVRSHKKTSFHSYKKRMAAANCSHFSAMPGSLTHEKEYDMPWLNSSTVAISIVSRTIYVSDSVPVLLGKQVNCEYQAVFLAPALIIPVSLGTRLP